MSTPGFRTRLWSVALASGLCLAPLAACGGSGPKPAELVEASLLRLTDLPDSDAWVVQEDETDPGQKELDKDLDECERRTDPTADVTEAQKDSDTYARGETDTASSSGWVVRDEAKRDAFFEALDEQLDCAGRALSAYLRSLTGGQGVEVTAPYVLEAETGADRTAGRAIQIGIRPGRNLARQTVFLDVVAVEEGELLAGYFFLHTGELTLEEETDVIARCLARLDQEQG
jgi:hypothetical protein